MKMRLRNIIYLAVYFYLIFPSICLLIGIIWEIQIVPYIGNMAYAFLPPFIPGIVLDSLFSIIILNRGHAGATGFIACFFNIVLWTFTCYIIYHRRTKILKEKYANEFANKNA